MQANGQLQEREAEVQQAREAIMRLNMQQASAAAAWEEAKRAMEQAHAEQVCGSVLPGRSKVLPRYS